MRFKNNSKLTCKQVGELALASGFVSAASGLVRVAGRFFVVADDENAFFEFDFDADSNLTGGRAYPISNEKLPEEHAARKRVKPDLESLFQMDFPVGTTDSSRTCLVALPSGSKENRVKGAMLELSENLLRPNSRPSQQESLISIAEIDVSPLYRVLGQQLTDLNIEGAVVLPNKLLLLQRGNSLSRVNAVIELDREVVANEIVGSRVISDKALRKITKIELPVIAGEHLTFTDACVEGEQVYFLAAAERTESTYDDGEFSAAVLGVLNQDCSAVESWCELDVEFKPEGLCCENKNGSLCFYFVTDADDSTKPSKLFLVV